MGKRIYPLKSIMYWYCYDIDDVCRLYKSYNLHPQTVYQWIKDGLPVEGNGKPILIYGNDLKKFLANLNKSNKCQTVFEQMFCMGCKEGKDPYKKQIHLEQAKGFVKAKAVCQTCKKIMNKGYKMDDIPKLRDIFRVVDVSQLYDCAAPTVKTHIVDQDKVPLNESRQWELFPA